MQDKVSVYNNPMGGAQAPPPPKPPPIYPFARDNLLNKNFIPPGTKFEDALFFNSKHQVRQPDVLDKFFKMLLSSISIKWSSYTGGRTPREPIQRKEKVEKPEVKKVDYLKKIEDGSDRVLITIGKAFKPLVYPPYKLSLSGLDLLGKAIVKGDQLVERMVQNGIVEPLKRLHAKIAPPIEKAASYITEKVTVTFEWLEREAERVIEFVIAPIQEALETVQTAMTRLYVPLRKGRNWLARKMPAIPKPSLPLEMLERVFVKPFKVFVNTFIATPLARVVQKMAEVSTPIQQGSQFLYKKGAMAYLILSNFCRAVGAKIGKRLESWFRKLGRFLSWLFKLLLAFAKRLGYFLMKLPKYLSKQVEKLYFAACRLTNWAASRFSR